MAGYLMSVTYTDSNTSQQHSVLWGVGNGEYASVVAAITGTENAASAYVRAKGQAPTAMSCTVSQTR